MKNEKNLKNEKFCIICQGNFLENEKLLNLNKKNFYHFQCILNWFRTKFECPVTRIPGCVILINKIHDIK